MHKATAFFLLATVTVVSGCTHQTAMVHDRSNTGPCAAHSLALLDTISIGYGRVLDFSASKVKPSSKRILLADSTSDQAIKQDMLEQLNENGYLFLSCFEFDASFRSMVRQPEFAGITNSIALACDQGRKCLQPDGPAVVLPSGVSIAPVHGKFLRGSVRVQCLGAMNGWDAGTLGPTNRWIQFVVPICP